MKAQNRGSIAASYVLSIVRIVVGFLFICHGLQIVFGMFGGHRASIHALLTTMLGIGGLLELLGGALIIIGLFTKPVAFVLCGEMAVAYFRVHLKDGVIPLQNHGELAVLYCFIFFYMLFAGGGAVSVDQLLRGKD